MQKNHPSTVSTTVVGSETNDRWGFLRNASVACSELSRQTWLVLGGLVCQAGDVVGGVDLPWVERFVL